MQNEIRQCQNCEKDFTIESEDFNFYKKIKVPSPTWCPECRLTRRLTTRNERTFYKRPCNSCDKSIISMYTVSFPYDVYCHDCWWGDKWDPMIFGTSYDFSKNFFEQFQSLSMKVPKISLFSGGRQLNSDYCNYTANNRNCYLCFGGKDDEQVLYSKNVAFSKESADIFSGDKLELCYENVECENSFRLSFSKQC